jgi:hypothetical protein
MLFGCREVDDIPSFPIGRHGPGDALFRFRQRFAQDIPDLTEPGAYSFLLGLDILFYGLWLSAVMRLVLFFEGPAAFWTFPAHLLSSSL